MNDLEKIKDNIRCMLNLARNDAAAEGEIQNAMNLATRLMNQHNLTEDDLGKVDEKILDLEKAELGKACSFSEGSKLSAWEGHLAHFVCDFVGGLKFYFNRHQTVRDENGLVKVDEFGCPKKAVKYTFYGLHEDTLIAKALYDELVVTVAAMARLRYGSVFRGRGRSYCEGFVVGLYEMHEEANRQEKLTASSQVKMGINENALMVIDQRALIVNQKKQLPERYVLQQKLKIKSEASVGYGIRDGGAHRAGVVDGRKAQVSANRPARIGS